MRTSKLRRPTKKIRVIDSMEASMKRGLPKVINATMKPAIDLVKRLQTLAEDQSVSDAELVAEIAKLKEQLPEVFKELRFAILQRFVYQHSVRAYKTGRIEKRKDFMEVKK